MAASIYLLPFDCPAPEAELFSYAEGLGGRRWPVERSNAWGLENRRLALRYDRLDFIVEALLQGACLILDAGRLVREF